MSKEEKNDIPYGYEQITYSRCGDSEVLEILRPAPGNAGQVSMTLSPNIRVNFETESSISVSDIVNRLKRVLKEQMEGENDL